jgi:hypothetical protein
MYDIAMLLLVFVSFALAGAYAMLCDRSLARSGEKFDNKTGPS